MGRPSTGGAVMPATRRLPGFGAAALARALPAAPDPVEELREGFAFLRLERVEPEKNAARFYELYWAPTLLGWAVVRTYGRIGRSQRTVVSPFTDEVQAWPFIRALVKRRLRHGYRVTAPPGVAEVPPRVMSSP